MVTLLLVTGKQLLDTQYCCLAAAAAEQLGLLSLLLARPLACVLYKPLYMHCIHLHS